MKLGGVLEDGVGDEVGALPGDEVALVGDALDGEVGGVGDFALGEVGVFGGDEFVGGALEDGDGDADFAPAGFHGDELAFEGEDFDVGLSEGFGDGPVEDKGAAKGLIPGGFFLGGVNGAGDEDEGADLGGVVEGELCGDGAAEGPADDDGGEVLGMGVEDGAEGLGLGGERGFEAAGGGAAPAGAVHGDHEGVVSEVGAGHEDGEVAPGAGGAVDEEDEGGGGVAGLGGEEVAAVGEVVGGVGGRGATGEDFGGRGRAGEAADGDGEEGQEEQEGGGPPSEAGEVHGGKKIIN